MSIKIKGFTWFLILLVILTQSSIFPKADADDPAAIAKDWYEYIESIPDGSAILFPIWYGPSNMNELFPMTLAVTHQLIQKDVKIIFVTFQAEGTDVINQALEWINPQNHGKLYGADWINLGYIAGSEVAVADLAKNLTFTGVDYYGNPLKQLPMMQSINSASDINLVILISDNLTAVGSFLRQWYVSFNVPIICGCTIALYPSVLPYYMAGMFSSILYGSSSVAEYEKLVGRPIYITSPNGGERWIRGTIHTLTWNTTGSPSVNVKIELLKGGALNKIITSSTANDGSLSWTVPFTQTLGADYKIRITSTSHPSINDSSNSNFAITAGSLTVTSPNGGEKWLRGTVHPIYWTSTGTPGANVKIELLKGGILNKVIVASTANDGSYSWTIPATQTLGTDYKIRITSTSNPTIKDSSNSNFAITAGVLTVTSPNGGQIWARGTTHAITWTSAGSPGAYVKIELLKGGVLNRVIVASTPNDGSYSWTIALTQTLGTDYRVRITSTTYPSITDSSNSNFRIS